jgi:hypothetical protein
MMTEIGQATMANLKPVILSTTQPATTEINATINHDGSMSMAIFYLVNISIKYRS